MITLTPAMPSGVLGYTGAGSHPARCVQRAAILDLVMPHIKHWYSALDLTATYSSESMKCSKQAGFYYDKLLSSCVRCSDVCGQHPTQCASFCQTSFNEVPEHRQSLSQDQTVLIYTLLGLSFFITIGSLLLILRCFAKNEADQCACKPSIAVGNEDGSLKDRLVNAETTGQGSSESSDGGTPDPIETCVFCYPESMPTIEEGGRNQGMAHPHRAVASQVASGGYPGTVPIDINYEERPFTIICSPSQEKTSMT